MRKTILTLISLLQEKAIVACGKLSYALPREPLGFHLLQVLFNYLAEDLCIARVQFLGNSSLMIFELINTFDQTHYNLDHQTFPYLWIQEPVSFHPTACTRRPSS